MSQLCFCSIIYLNFGFYLFILLFQLYYVRAHAFREAASARWSITSFCPASIHIVKLESVLIPLVSKPHGPFPIHISMILSTLGLSPRGIVFGLFPQKISYHLDIIHAYILRAGVAKNGVPNAILQPRTVF